MAQPGSKASRTADAAGFDALLRRHAAEATSRIALWRELLSALDVRSMAEIGVYRGRFARALLAHCRQIDTYWLVDPWRHLPDWNKPANTDDDAFERIHRDALSAIAPFAERCRVLRGTTTEVLDRIPDGSLDAVYIDGDHTLKGITIDLVRAFPKVREGGLIAGDDFTASIWQHRTRFEPSLVFPFAVHFAEAVGARIHALPFDQFLIRKETGGAFSFIDLAGRYPSTALAAHLGWRAATRRRLREIWKGLRRH